jgi:hypothetical protein
LKLEGGKKTFNPIKYGIISSLSSFFTPLFLFFFTFFSCCLEIDNKLATNFPLTLYAKDKFGKKTHENTHQSPMYKKSLWGSAQNLAYVHQQESFTTSKLLQLTINAHTTQIQFALEKSLARSSQYK